MAKGIIAVYPEALVGPGKSEDGSVPQRAWQGAPYSKVHLLHISHLLTIEILYLKADVDDVSASNYYILLPAHGNSGFVYYGHHPRPPRKSLRRYQQNLRIGKKQRWRFCSCSILKCPLYALIIRYILRQTNILACNSTSAPLFAAFAPVSAALYPDTHPINNCTPGRVIPIINFHGLDDDIIPFDGRLADVWTGDKACKYTACPRLIVA